jgi:dihydroxy-acid dehydratase
VRCRNPFPGTILPGCLTSAGNKPVDIVSVFEAVGQHAAGKFSDAGLHEVESCAIPGPGSCGGMFWAMGINCETSFSA